MTESPISISEVHSILLGWIVDHGYVPSVEDLSLHLDRPEAAVIQALHELQEYHGVVLHPHRPEVWVIHPFSTAPTVFLLEASDRKWWANCAWCALGAAALLDRDTTISTLLGAENEQVAIHVRDGDVIDREYCVHFPVPMRKAWENVIYTCSTMLLFRDEPAVDEWCHRHRLPKGDVQPIVTVWEFAKVWYGNYLEPTWTKWTTAEAREIFTRFGFKGDVWDLPATAERF